MGDILNIIIGDYELLDENFYYNRIYDNSLKNNHIKRVLKHLGVDNVSFNSLEEAVLSTNQNYVYIIYKQSRYQFNDEIRYLNQNLIDALRKYPNIKLIYFLEDESFDFDNFKLIHDYISFENIPHEQVYVFNNNAKMEEYRKLLKSKLNVHKSSYLSISYSKKFELTPYQFITNKKFLFLVQNKRLKIHRFALLCFLIKNKIIKKSDWSFLENHMYGNLEFFTNSNIERLLTPESYRDEINQLSNLKNKKCANENQTEDIKFLTDFLNIDTFEQSYINITTETHFFENDVHISEKSFKPFYFSQLPIFVSTHQHVNKMRELYGYDFFDDIINHSYDNEVDPMVRFNMVCDEIKRLSENENLIKQFYLNNKTRFEKNKKITLELKNINDSKFFYNI